MPETSAVVSDTFTSVWHRNTYTHRLTNTYTHPPTYVQNKHKTQIYTTYYKGSSSLLRFKSCFVVSLLSAELWKSFWSIVNSELYPKTLYWTPLVKSGFLNAIFLCLPAGKICLIPKAVTSLRKILIIDCLSLSRAGHIVHALTKTQLIFKTSLTLEVLLHEFSFW